MRKRAQTGPLASLQGSRSTRTFAAHSGRSRLRSRQSASCEARAAGGGGGRRRWGGRWEGRARLERARCGERATGGLRPHATEERASTATGEGCGSAGLVPVERALEADADVHARGALRLGEERSDGVRRLGVAVARHRHKDGGQRGGGRRGGGRRGLLRRCGGWRAQARRGWRGGPGGRHRSQLKDGRLHRSGRRERWARGGGWRRRRRRQRRRRCRPRSRHRSELKDGGERARLSRVGGSRRRGPLRRGVDGEPAGESPARPVCDAHLPRRRGRGEGEGGADGTDGGDESREAACVVGVGQWRWWEGVGGCGEGVVRVW